jgi:hypothetical protein
MLDAAAVPAEIDPRPVQRQDACGRTGFPRKGAMSVEFPLTAGFKDHGLSLEIFILVVAGTPVLSTIG